MFSISRYYAPALGFLMFAVGVNSRENDFLEAFKRPAALFAGYVGQFVVKPLLGYFFGIISVTLFGLPTSIGQEISLSLSLPFLIGRISHCANILSVFSCIRCWDYVGFLCQWGSALKLCYFSHRPTNGPSKHYYDIIVYCYCSICHTNVITLAHWKKTSC